MNGGCGGMGSEAGHQAVYGALKNVAGGELIDQFFAAGAAGVGFEEGARDGLRGPALVPEEDG